MCFRSYDYENNSYEDFQCEKAQDQEGVIFNLQEEQFCLRDQIKSLVSILYGTAPIDKKALEMSLDEVCDILDINTNVGFLNIERVQQCLILR